MASRAGPGARSAETCPASIGYGTACGEYRIDPSPRHVPVRAHSTPLIPSPLVSTTGPVTTVTGIPAAQDQDAPGAAPAGVPARGWGHHRDTSRPTPCSVRSPREPAPGG